jgi:DNA ligase D-like protein (predicted 3'-phosphoesterase)
MVHKHDARRLHSDLRLEIDGAFASWALPKGPSYDPTERRLAIETEEHPLEYARLGSTCSRARLHFTWTVFKMDTERRSWRPIRCAAWRVPKLK